MAGKDNLELKQITSENILEFNTDVFIIPNHAGTINNHYMMSDRKKDWYDKIGEMNGIEFDRDKCKLIQLWFVCNDLYSTNLTDHGGIVSDANGNKINIRPDIDLLPANLFAEYNEGDIVDLHIPYTFELGENSIDVEMIIHAKLNQTSYRYRGFGTFQEAFHLVTR